MKNAAFKTVEILIHRVFNIISVENWNHFVEHIRAIGTAVWKTDKIKDDMKPISIQLGDDMDPISIQLGDMTIRLGR
jgi:hypothetical protein